MSSAAAEKPNFPVNVREATEADIPTILRFVSNEKNVVELLFTKHSLPFLSLHSD